MLIPIFQHFQVWSYTPFKNTGKVHCLKKKRLPLLSFGNKTRIETNLEYSTKLIS